MAHLRNRHECLTGCQDRSPWSGKTDMQHDFIMVYGIDADMPNRIVQYRSKGYVTHLMTGSAWGDYQDYLNGEFDGVDHWDESQMDRRGNPILHGVSVPYLCPSLSFCRYLTEKLKPAVDTGVEAIHLEEPEFWDEGGYSEGFKREYRSYFGTEWQAPHLSPENRYKAAELKVFLYKRLVEYVSRELKKYAKEKYDRDLKFYVPTHSLVNYTQWKILSPEGTLLDIPTVDGCIAQVWTGTSRVGNVYKGRYDERTFETALLEYGVMQELVRGTGRRMWFLHDPIEDNPEYTWENFKMNYLKTVIASLMHPEVHHYEVSPWPSRVFNGIYPKKMRITSGMQPGEVMDGAKPIPLSYAELICAMTQTLGDMDQPESRFEGNPPNIGIFMADTGLYQRTFPDSVPSRMGVEKLNEIFISLRDKQRENICTKEESQRLFDQIARDEALYNDYVTSGPFPHFFGMAMPLIKSGIPLRPVQLENVSRYHDYLDAYDTLLLSYEFMKPRDSHTHEILAQWVQKGGKLIYVGDHTDPYHKAHSWWNTGAMAYEHPAQHLFETLQMPMEAGTQPLGKGFVTFIPLSPARITLTKESAESFLAGVLAVAAPGFTPRNYLLMQRGVYKIVCVMEESVSCEPLTLKGCFADMLENDFPIIREKTLLPGDNALLFDLDKIAGEKTRIIGTSARIYSLDETTRGYVIRCKAAADIPVHMRLKLPAKVQSLSAIDESGTLLPAAFRWDEATSTVLITFQSTNSLTVLTLKTE